MNPHLARVFAIVFLFVFPLFGIAGNRFPAITGSPSQIEPSDFVRPAAPSSPASVTRNVNKTSGPYFSIGAAIAASGPGDIVQITDNSIYYEAVVIGPALAGLTLQALPGYAPWISGEALAGTASVVTVSAPATLKNIGVYVGGATYGVQTTVGAVLIDGMSFDVHIPPRGPNWTFGVFAGGDIVVQNSNFLGPDTTGQTSGGILSNSSAVTHIAVSRSDFWGLGTAGGSIGVGLPAGSTLSVVGSVFGQTSTAGPIIAINNWGSTTLTENTNAFRNITTPLAGFAGTTLSANDKKTFGSTAPVYTQAPDAMTTADAAANTLTTFLGCAIPSSFPYPDKSTLESLLDRTVMSNYYTLSPVTAAVNVDTLTAMSEMRPRIWEEFEISWMAQYDPLVWQVRKLQVANVRAQPNLGQVILMGNLMEAILGNDFDGCTGDCGINATPMSADFWLWYAYQYPDAASRPLQAKVVNGRRYHGHFFSYDAMIGPGTYGRDAWLPGVSVPNAQSQEVMAYYLELTRDYIDAGMNAIQFNQPQLTFSSNDITHTSVQGVKSLKTLTRFIKNYGACRAPLVNGHRFALVSLSEAYNGVRNGGVDLVDYAEAIAGSYPNGVGRFWTCLDASAQPGCDASGDSYHVLPDAGIPLAGKPLTLIIDNVAPGDEISMVAVATPAFRNQWLESFDHAVSSLGYHLVLNGIRQLSSGWEQNFTGYINPYVCFGGSTGGLPCTTYPALWLLPFDPQGDMASTQEIIFAPR